MPFDRQSSHHGLLTGLLFPLAMAVLLDARAGPPTPIEGTSYFVAPAGVGVSTDRNRPGGVNDTVRKICDGTATQIGGGDGIVFLDGTYLTSTLNLPLPADSRQSGRHGNAIAMLDKNCGGPLYIKLLADNRRAAVLRNDVTANTTSGGFDIRNSSYIWIEGFHIIGVNNAAVPWEGGIKFSDGSHHVVARDNYIQSTGGGGIGAGGATHIRIENNEIYGTANMHPYCASAISLYRLENTIGAADDESGYANHIVGNRVFGTRSRVGCDADTNPVNGIRSSDGNCIILDLNNETEYRNRTLIANNLCVNNGGGGVHLYNSGFTDVTNNTLYSNGAVHRIGEISVTCNQAGTNESTRFFNNLVWATMTAPAVASNFASRCALLDVVHSHNVFVGLDPQLVDFLGVKFPEMTGDFTVLGNTEAGNLRGVAPAAAGFARPSLDPTLADFSVTSLRSPLVNVGINRFCANPADTVCQRGVLPASLTVDVAGSRRMNGVLIDVGAYEYQVAAEPTPPTLTRRIVLRARATKALGAGAAVEIYGNGKLLGKTAVDQGEFADFAFLYEDVERLSRIDIVFTNDVFAEPEDRNLFVESVSVDELVLRPTDPGALVDVGGGAEAFDSEGLIAGQAALWWNAALRLTVPPAD